MIIMTPLFQENLNNYANIGFLFIKTADVGMIIPYFIT